MRLNRAFTAKTQEGEFCKCRDRGAIIASYQPPQVHNFGAFTSRPQASTSTPARRCVRFLGPSTGSPFTVIPHCLPAGQAGRQCGNHSPSLSSNFNSARRSGGVYSFVNYYLIGIHGLPAVGMVLLT